MFHRSNLVLRSRYNSSTTVLRHMVGSGWPGFEKGRMQIPAPMPPKQVCEVRPGGVALDEKSDGAYAGNRNRVNDS
jgi:hypothetical protein